MNIRDKQKAAKILGLRYFSHPCGKCGCAVRYAANTECVDCHAARAQCAPKSSRIDHFANGESLCLVRSARSAATLAGERFYMGKACPHGHGTLRYTVSAQCVECKRTGKRYDSRRKGIATARHDGGTSRLESLAKGLRFYETQPCNRCGDTRRYTSQRSCPSCH